MRGLKIIQANRRYRRLRRTCWLLFLSTTIALALGVLVLYGLSHGPRRGDQLVTRQAPRIFADLHSALPVELHLDPAALPGAARVPKGGRHLDILIGLDNSLTMQYEAEGLAPIEQVKSFARELIAATDLDRHQIGLVRMDEEAQVVHGLSRNRATLERTLAELPAGRSTRVGSALDAMGPEFRSLRHQPDALAVAILLTDGRTSSAAARRAVERLADEHLAFVAPIGLGDAVDDDLLRSIASFPGEYARGDSAAELVTIYQRWIETFERLVAVDVRLTERLNLAGFRLEEAPGAEIDGGELVWRLPFLTDAGWTFDYRLEASALGWRGIDEPQGEVVLRPVGGDELRLPVHRKPKVIVGVLWLWLLLALLPLLFLLPWLFAWWRRRLARRGGSLLPDELPPPAGPPVPDLLPALALDRLVRPTSPSVIVGLGGTGRWVLTYLKKALLDTNYGRLPETVRLLHIDTRAAEAEEGTKRVEVGGVRLSAEECLILGGDPADPGALYERTRRLARGEAQESHLQDWWPAKEFARLPAEQLQHGRGTNQRRPMGRMALFLDLERGAAESRLWQRLSQDLESVSAAAEGDPTIFVITSTIGGSGSGMALDATYLARQIALDCGFTGAVVNLLAALPESFATRGDSLGLAGPNSFAFLRELDRFLSQRDRNFPLRYTPAGDDLVDGSLDAPLVDNCYLFDGQRQRHPLTEVSPEKAVFPAMADVLHTFLYATPGGSLDSELQQRKAVAELALENSGHGVIASLGSYVFRLPMYDFLERFKPRFARELVADLFGARRGEDGRWEVPPPSAERQAALDQALDDFLRREGPERTPVDFLQVVALSDAELLLAVLENDRALGESERYLELRLINGRRTLTAFWLDQLTVDVATPGNRFADALYLARQLRSRLEVLAEQIAALPRLPGRGRLARLARRWVQGYAEAITTIASGLVDYRTGVPALLELLEVTEADRLSARRQEAEVLVRETLYDEELEERLYQDHLGEATRQRCLERFVWTQVENSESDCPSLELQVVADSLLPMPPWDLAAPGPAAEPAAALVELLLQPMWDLSATPYLEAAYPDPELWAEKVFDHAAPLIAFDRAAAPRHGQKLFTTLGEGEYAKVACERLYPEFPRRRHVRSTESRDPHALSTVMILDSLPLPSLLAYRKAARDYATFPDAARAQLHLFAAERRTVEMERRLSQVQEPRRAFHPRFVADLARPEHLESFAQAALHGFIEGFFDPRPAALGLAMESDEVLPLAAEGGRLEALASFTTGEATDGRSLPLAQIQASVERLRQRTESEEALLRDRLAQLQQIKTNDSIPPAERDLLSYLSLAANERLEHLGRARVRTSNLTGKE